MRSAPSKVVHSSNYLKRMFQPLFKQLPYPMFLQLLNWFSHRAHLIASMNVQTNAPSTSPPNTLLKKLLRQLLCWSFYWFISRLPVDYSADCSNKCIVDCLKISPTIALSTSSSVFQLINTLITLSITLKIATTVIPPISHQFFLWLVLLMIRRLLFNYSADFCKWFRWLIYRLLNRSLQKSLHFRFINCNYHQHHMHVH